MVWLWSGGPADKIGSEGLEILTNGEEDLYFSAASSWEITIKTKLGRLDLPGTPGRYVPKRLPEQDIHPFSVTQSHRLKVYDLPLHDQDPFDRLMTAQAMVEGMTVLTADRAFRKYEVDVVWCGG